jgi:hypothetical protein
MIVECLAGCLYGEDSGEFTLVDAENLRQGSPGSTEEEGVKLTVVLNLLRLVIEAAVPV